MDKSKCIGNSGEAERKVTTFSMMNIITVPDTEQYAQTSDCSSNIPDEIEFQLVNTVYHRSKITL